MPEYFPQLNLPQGLAEEVARQQEQNAQIIPNAINGAVKRVFQAHMQKKMMQLQFDNAKLLETNKQAGRQAIANTAATARVDAANVNAGSKQMIVNGPLQDTLSSRGYNAPLGASIPIAFASSIARTSPPQKNDALDTLANQNGFPIPKNGWSKQDENSLYKFVATKNNNIPTYTPGIK